MVVSNQPFTEVDNPQFRRLISYGKPIIAEKMVHATQLKERLLTEFEHARDHFKKTLKVRRTLSYRYLNYVMWNRMCRAAFR